MVTKVIVCDGHDKCHWRPGKVVQRRGPVSYQVQLENGTIHHKHVDHLCEWVPQSVADPLPPESQSVDVDITATSKPLVDTPSISPAVQTGEEQRGVDLPDHSQESRVPATTANTNPVVTPRCYPRRQRRPVDRF